jgi:prevent-host-death family protein
MRVSIKFAKAHFAEMLRAAEEGNRIVITKRGEPVAELVQTSGNDDGEPYTRQTGPPQATQRDIRRWLGL